MNESKTMETNVAGLKTHGPRAMARIGVHRLVRLYWGLRAKRHFRLMLKYGRQERVGLRVHHAREVQRCEKLANDPDQQRGASV